MDALLQEEIARTANVIADGTTCARAHVRTRDRGELKNYARTHTRARAAAMRAYARDFLFLPPCLISDIAYIARGAIFVTRECA